MRIFILETRKKLPPEPAASSEEKYDRQRQIWIDRKSQEPLVCRIHSGIKASNYGETLLTKTLEGADTTETSAWDVSSYAETIKTATREGADQPDRAIIASSYGETVETRTREGADQTEISSIADAGPLATAPPKIGPNTTQILSDRLPNAAHSHF